jgi:hypothetical protein
MLNFKVILSVVLFLGLQQAYGQNNAAQLLLGAYASQCPSVVNRQVQGSLINVQALRSVVEQFKAQSQCSGAQTLSPILQQYNQTYEDYQVYNNDRDLRLSIQRKIALYTSMLNDPGLSGSQIGFLQDEIIYAQADLIGLETRISRFDQLQGRAPRAADATVQAITQFLGSWDGSNQCFTERRSLAASLLSNTFMATSAFAAPATSLGLAAAALTIESLNRFLNDFKMNNLLSEVDDIQMPLAMACVSEAVTNQYCEAHDTARLLRSYGLDSSGGHIDRQYEGLDLMARHLNRLDHWLKEVFAGSAITSEGDLINREKPILQAQLLEKIRRYMQTYGTIRDGLYQSISSPNERSDAIAIGIENLVYIMLNPSLNPGPNYSSSTSIENPIFLTRDSRLLAFQLYDDNISDTPLCASGMPCSRLSDYIRSRGLTLTFSDWQNSLSNALLVVERSLEIVNIARSRTISVDAFTVLVGANQDFRGDTNALQGLIKIVENAERIGDYLTELGCQSRAQDCDQDGHALFTHRYFPQLMNINITKELTEQVIQLIGEAYTPRSLNSNALPQECQLPNETFRGVENGFEAKSFQITSCITRILKLAERGNDVYFTKVRAMIAYEMEARFVSGEFTNDTADLIGATRGDLVNSLMQSLYPSGDGSLPQIMSGLESAQYLSQETLYSFYKVFEKHIEEQFEEGPRNHLQMNELCLRFIPYFMRLGEKDKFARTVEQKCARARLQFYDNGPSVAFSDLVVSSSSRGPLGGRRFSYEPRNGRSQSDVFCALRRYNRKNYLYEQQRRSKDKSFQTHFDFVEYF